MKSTIFQVRECVLFIALRNGFNRAIFEDFYGEYPFQKHAYTTQFCRTNRWKMPMICVQFSY